MITSRLHADHWSDWGVPVNGALRLGWYDAYRDEMNGADPLIYGRDANLPHREVLNVTTAVDIDPCYVSTHAEARLLNDRAHQETVDWGPFVPDEFNLGSVETIHVRGLTSGDDSNPAWWPDPNAYMPVYANMRVMAWELCLLRMLVGPLRIVSGLRSTEENGGVARSAHLLGLATDIAPAYGEMDAFFCDGVYAFCSEFNLTYSEYPTRGFIHVDWRHRLVARSVV